jgi:S-disulfanyl-L-cysteine oxidoreductase SoxD
MSAILCAAAASLAAQKTTSSVLDGVYTDPQAARGAALYAQHCALCHGVTLGGLGEAPALVGPLFVSDFNGLTLGDLYDRVRTTMPLTAPASLGRERYADILAFVLKSNGFPAGQRELDRRSEFLNTIAFEALKVR